jgi:hypothetical protein
MGRVHLADDRDEWRTLVNTVSTLRAPKRQEIFCGTERIAVSQN